MKLDIDRQKGVKLVLYPDNQPHVILDATCASVEVDVVAKLRSSLDVMNLLSVANALTHCGATKGTLTIPYLLGARSDRVVKPMESVELEIIASLLNSCAFKRVAVLDAHSPATGELIKGYYPLTNQFLVDTYDRPDAVLICPDAGAKRKVGQYMDWNKNIKEVMYCDKERDKATGRVALIVKDPKKFECRNCIIIDDICDGGATFLAIAKQVTTAHLTLMVTHGIFSKGMTALDAAFDQIVCSDSYNLQVNDSYSLKVIPFKA